MIRPFRGKHPQIHPTAYVAETAVVIGDVLIGAESSVWFGAVVRESIDEFSDAFAELKRLGDCPTRYLTCVEAGAQAITAHVLREAARIRAAAGLKPRTQSTRPPPWQPAACCSSPTMRITVNSPHCRSLS